MENYLTSAGISARQSPPADILVLVQETPFTDLRRKEINGLLKKGVFAVVIEKDVPQGVCIFNSRFINKIKHPNTYLSRDIFIRPPLKLNLQLGTILWVVKPLYRVPEARNHWFKIYYQYYVRKLKIEQLTYNPCLLYTLLNGLSIIRLQIDNTLFLVDWIFADAKETKLQEAKFLAKP
jgi:hypothetical protein